MESRSWITCIIVDTLSMDKAVDKVVPHPQSVCIDQQLVHVLLSSTVQPLLLVDFVEWLLDFDVKRA